MIAKIIAYYTFLIILLVMVSFGQEFEKTGTTGFVFLEIPVTARYSSLGETGLTLKDGGAEGIFINPALTALSPGRFSINVSYSKWYVETTHQALGFTYRWPLIGTFGWHIVYFDFGELEKTRNPYSSRNEYGSYISLGKFSAGSLATGLTFARQLTEKFSFGTSVKYIRETIDVESAENVIMDIGFFYDTGFRSLRIGAFLKDFGLEAKYVNEKFKMPQQLKFGVGYDFIGNIDSPNQITILAEAVHPNDANERIHLGVEARFIELFILRGGYKFNYRDENFCAGAGLNFNYQGKLVHFDFSYMNHQYLDSNVRFTFSAEL